MFGLTNPAAGHTGTFGVYLKDNVSGDVLAYDDFGDSLTVAAPPQALNMTEVYASTYSVNTMTEYRFGFKTLSESLASDGVVYIDWPIEYKGAFFFEEYDCTLDSPEVAGDISCDWVVALGKLRTEITGFTAIPAYSDEITITLQNLPTPNYPGETGSFVISTYDPVSQVILERSFTETTSEKTIDFYSENYSIYTKTDLVVTVVANTYSDLFDVTLQIPTYEELELIPYSTDNAMKFMPSTLSFLYNWDKTEQIRVGADGNIPYTNKAVSFRQFAGDNIAGLYSNIRDIHVNVVHPDK